MTPQLMCCGGFHVLLTYATYDSIGLVGLELNTVETQETVTRN